MCVVISITVIGAIGIWASVFVLVELDHPFALRLISPQGLASMLLATIVLAGSLPISTYLRAHKQEPLLLISLINGLMTAIVVIVMGRYYSTDGVALGYLAVNLVTVPFVFVIWKSFRHKWHNMAC
jgi:hypothetical protein